MFNVYSLSFDSFSKAKADVLLKSVLNTQPDVLRERAELIKEALASTALFSDPKSFAAVCSRLEELNIEFPSALPVFVHVASKRAGLGSLATSVALYALQKLPSDQKEREGWITENGPRLQKTTSRDEARQSLESWWSRWRSAGKENRVIEQDFTKLTIDLFGKKIAEKILAVDAKKQEELFTLLFILSDEDLNSIQDLPFYDLDYLKLLLAFPKGARDLLSKMGEELDFNALLKEVAKQGNQFVPKIKVFYVEWEKTDRSTPFSQFVVERFADSLRAVRPTLAKRGLDLLAERCRQEGFKHHTRKDELERAIFAADIKKLIVLLHPDRATTYNVSVEDLTEAFQLLLSLI